MAHWKQEEMRQIIARAKPAGLWLHASYHDLWFSPQELERSQARGKFCWGPVNWTLRHPQEYLDGLERQIDSLRDAHRQFYQRMVFKEAENG